MNFYNYRPVSLSTMEMWTDHSDAGPMCRQPGCRGYESLAYRKTVLYQIVWFKLGDRESSLSVEPLDKLQGREGTEAAAIKIRCFGLLLYWCSAAQRGE